MTKQVCYLVNRWLDSLVFITSTQTVARLLKYLHLASGSSDIVSSGKSWNALQFECFTFDLVSTEISVVVLC